MYKAGDKFEIVRSGYMGECVQPGDIVEYFGPSEFPGVERAMFKTKNGQVLFFTISGGGACTVRPLRTEAEKRGAKFGVGGVVNETSAVKNAIGKKILFVGIAQNSMKEEVWNCAIEGEDELMGFLPCSIRLDHEPEYKEIPFSEGTHEQRMDAGNLIIDEGFGVSEIMKFDMAGYVYTVRGKTKVYTDTSRLTIRIPT